MCGAGECDHKFCSALCAAALRALCRGLRCAWCHAVVVRGTAEPPTHAGRCRVNAELDAGRASDKASAAAVQLKGLEQVLQVQPAWRHGCCRCMSHHLAHSRSACRCVPLWLHRSSMHGMHPS